MAIRTDAQGPRPVVTVEALLPATSAADPRREALDRLLRIPIGQTLQAQVLSALKDGTFLVRLGDAAARMALPGAKPGDLLSLTLSTKEPRPTFTLNPQAGSPSTALSPTARLIDRLLQMIAREGSPAPSVGSKTPLIDAPDAGAVARSSHTADAEMPAVDTPRLAAALREAVASSGLFYESHLKQWTEGRLPVTDVLREPQAQIGRFFQPGAEPSANADARHQQMANLVGAQFEALEQQRLLWEGEAWLGLPMEWRVERDPGSQESQEPAAEQSWQSEVRFDMPRLGTVTAKLRLAGGAVQMTLEAEDKRAAVMLRSRHEALADALGAAGSRLDGFLVRHGR